MDLFAADPRVPTGEVGILALDAPAGVTDVVIGLGTAAVPGVAIGAVCSLACGTPIPGRARRVMRTVSFFSGTAEVFTCGVGGALGWMGLSSLMV